MHIEAHAVGGPHHALRGGGFQADVIDLQQWRRHRSATARNQRVVEEVIAHLGRRLLDRTAVLHEFAQPQRVLRCHGELHLGVFEYLQYQRPVDARPLRRRKISAACSGCAVTNFAAWFSAATNAR